MKAKIERRNNNNNIKKILSDGLEKKIYMACLEMRK